MYSPHLTFLFGRLTPKVLKLVLIFRKKNFLSISIQKNTCHQQMQNLEYIHLFQSYKLSSCC